jgi:hypothetical protein
MTSMTSRSAKRTVSKAECASAALKWYRAKLDTLYAANAQLRNQIHDHLGKDAGKRAPLIAPWCVLVTFHICSGEGADVDCYDEDHRVTVQADNQQDAAKQADSWAWDYSNTIPVEGNALINWDIGVPTPGSC